ncbi:uncharacterized protein LOC143452500 [Clavelina lepadiformis]|uniref:uncharacterized protein LOC143452500 n=1 Tax=Clavelina lepadiformis TaxID=159417 RepID=UPI00404274C1
MRSAISKGSEFKRKKLDGSDGVIEMQDLQCCKSNVLASSLFLMILMGLASSMLYGMQMENEVVKMRNEIERNRKIVGEMLKENNEHESLIDFLQMENEFAVNRDVSHEEVEQNSAHDSLVKGLSHDFNNQTNEDVLSEQGKRIRRQSSVVEQYTFIGAHLVGANPADFFVSEPSSQCGAYFLWDDTKSASSVSRIRVSHESNGTFLVIQTPGFYYVYSQVTSSTENYLAGHKTVRIADHESTTLMSSIVTQVSFGVDNFDSTYHGGVFYMLAGDKLGVQLAETSAGHVFNMQEGKSFFGAAFLGSYDPRSSKKRRYVRNPRPRCKRIRRLMTKAMNNGNESCVSLADYLSTFTSLRRCCGIVLQ